MQSRRLQSLFFRLTMIALVLGLVSGATLGNPARGQAQDPGHSVFLPLILSTPASTLFGTVTHQGQPSKGIRILLFKWDSVQRSSVPLTTATTDASGRYRFDNVPDTTDTEWYGAAYQNARNGNADRPDYVFSCETNLLGGYKGEYWNLGDFDIANFAMLAPEPGAVTVLPVTLRWQTRPATPQDSYYVGIYGLSGDSARFRSYDLGYADHLTLNNLPSKNDGAELQGVFQYGTTYFWYPWVMWPRSICDANDTHRITFQQ